MHVRPIQTRTLQPPKDDLFAVLDEYLPQDIPEKSIIVVTSKVVSIGEGACIPVDQVPDKDVLIQQESDEWLPRDYVPERWVMHTITRGMFMPTAGIDASNADNHYILPPKDAMGSAEKIQKWILNNRDVSEIGVLITDSRSLPMRRGTVGVGIGFAGFSPIHDFRDQKDLFGKKLMIAMTNVVDSLAGAAVFTMGEGDQSTPLAIITDIPTVQFGAPESSRPFSHFFVDRLEDIYAPFLNNAPWRKGNKGNHA